MQLDAQLWSNLLGLSGCFHHILFDFAPGRSATTHPDKFGNPLQVHDELMNRLVTIPAKSVFMLQKTLGLQKSPAANNMTQLSTL
jgi:hypothetical protein